MDSVEARRIERSISLLFVVRFYWRSIPPLAANSLNSHKNLGEKKFRRVQTDFFSMAGLLRFVREHSVRTVRCMQPGLESYLLFMLSTVLISFVYHHTCLSINDENEEAIWTVKVLYFARVIR